jgi:hypothetical protein
MRCAGTGPHLHWEPIFDHQPRMQRGAAAALTRTHRSQELRRKAEPAAAERHCGTRVALL